MADRMRAGLGPRLRRREAAGGVLESSDAVVRDTDTDAAVSRLSAVRVGYLCDGFAEGFVSGSVPRRLPIINRGTYVRTRALDLIVQSFLSHTEGPAQIISLGAGTDTRPFRLRERSRVIYHEVDFADTCRRKYRAARALDPLSGSLQDVETAEGGSWSARWQEGGEYHCHAADLRNEESLHLALQSTMRLDLPTLLLSECCLCYLSDQDSSRVLAYMEEKLQRLALAVYEPMPLDDSFGRMMLSNLEARRIRMPSAERYRDAEGQEARLRRAGFVHVGHATVEEIWDEWVDDEEKARLDALEGLDEVEEWRLLAAHYVVAWGNKGAGLLSSNFGRISGAGHDSG
ncbi:Leucine carboxyl methyltransferase superfamily [Ophiocordyceps camponoti-floridani]|uniref:Leucine carboxyl methyltransferase 1 n=1 Tax=Ophiocordyceps camponoti-floridani TaxID=2030778 RepID=A0A8H4VD23_9HYPO|nr:Leucine carboxyl methyltransferase superfamily [Ophiocordyceps camponoti-floridani]